MSNMTNWKKTIVAGSLLLALTATGCSVKQTEEGKMPDVDVSVKEGNMPKVDVDPATVEIKTETKEVEVPDVDVSTETKEVAVPDVDVTVPDDGN